MPPADNRANCECPPLRDCARPPCRSVDWYSEGESRVVEYNGVQIVVRFVGRKGRRGRIVIEAPEGSEFS